MLVFEINPLSDPRWTAFLESHPRSSIFHTTAWLEALRRTYDYTPRVFTTGAPGMPLTNGIVFCHVNSWLTGSKLVSLPFSDHCEPLVEGAADLRALISGIRESSTGTGEFKHAEIRPLLLELEPYCGGRPHRQYCFHMLDLRPRIEELYLRLHKDCVRRKIRRAEREHVVLYQGNSDELLEQFYQLLLVTRRRHGVPPQPLTWFRNLRDCFGTHLTVRVARVANRPIASILTLRHKQTLTYKYGGSDSRFHNLGAMPRLFWQAIQDAKAEHLTDLDLGRSDEDNSGLVRFKDHLGATKTSIRYWQLSRTAPVAAPLNAGRMGSIVGSLPLRMFVSHLPDALFRLTGEVLYRHAG